MNKHFASAGGLALCLLSGCLDPDPTSGSATPSTSCPSAFTRGAIFRYLEQPAPFDGKIFDGPQLDGPVHQGCPGVAERNLIAGGSQTFIEVILGRQQPALRSVSSSDPEVATFALTSDPRHLLVTSGQVGTTDLVAIDEDGNKLPRATLRVSHCAKLALYHDFVDMTSLTPILFAGSPYLFIVGVTDGQGPMQGIDAVRFSFTGGLSPAAPAPGRKLPSNSVRFTGSRGMGQVLATCPDGSGSLQAQVSIVGPQDLTAVSAVPTSIQIPRGKDDMVIIETKAGANLVSGVPCTWTSTPVGLLAEPPLDAVIEGQSVMYYKLHGEPGVYQATCAVPGGLSTSVSVAVQ